MKLTIATPLGYAVREEDVRSLRAEDPRGSFGILPGHADFLAPLAVSVVSWRGADGNLRHCAVRGGVLTVRGGSEIAVATPEAVPGDDLETLRESVLRHLAKVEEEAKTARLDLSRLQLAAMQRLVTYSRPEVEQPRPGRIERGAGEGENGG